ncbi:uncharacterized protein [Arachis hypogaea]|uniref:uncharacterized protein isoform X1 n=1 Tax=Arachis hypogaea TaxID=3818 RepID=UPI003B221084
MYIETHKKKDGSFVTDEARDIAKQIEVLIAQNEKNESGPSTNDAIGKVFEEEHSGRVRCMRLGATPTNTFRNINHPSQLMMLRTKLLHRQQEEHHQTEALKIVKTLFNIALKID